MIAGSCTDAELNAAKSNPVVNNPNLIISLILCPAIVRDPWQQVVTLRLWQRNWRRRPGPRR